MLAARTMLVWSSPLSTSISPQTLCSLPLTFFFGMSFSATSFVIPLPPGPGDDGRELAFSVRLSADAPCSASAACSLGTFQVAC